MVTTITLRDGTEEYAERWRYRRQEYFEKAGRFLGWIDENGTPRKSVSDRLGSAYVIELPSGAIETNPPLFSTGFSHLPLQHALAMGFSTSEYQAGLRYQMLYNGYLQTEEELVHEQIPPRDRFETICREGNEGWDERNPTRRVPYPSEEHFARYQVRGWLGGVVPEDRLATEFELLDSVSGNLIRSRCCLNEIGLESLSITDALNLGFNTAEYQAALRTRVFERRHILDEADLAEAIVPPSNVCWALEAHGRGCSAHRNADDFRAKSWTNKDELWTWITRRDAPRQSKSGRPDGYRDDVSSISLPR
ncbi:hypothetical protein HJA95_08385 [Rhizobium binae]|uniref:hypothetical protein n=1 Tax=Rhizobium binae TaxID=1138190 RepID=UPI001C83339A|nr:hypothetical protein [Rhizobium binae]MBX4949596.1 hypothetical protein [Rhizobium binae]